MQKFNAKQVWGRTVVTAGRIKARHERSLFPEQPATRKVAAATPDVAGGKEYHLTLPYPPALNHLYAVVRGRKILSKQGRQYKKDAGAIARQARIEMSLAEISVTVRVYRPRRAGDLDNTLKVMLDSLTGLAWQDDKQITHIEARRFDDKANPRVELTIRPVSQQAA